MSALAGAGAGIVSGLVSGYFSARWQAKRSAEERKDVRKQEALDNLKMLSRRLINAMEVRPSIAELMVDWQPLEHAARELVERWDTELVDRIPDEGIHNLMARLKGEFRDLQAAHEEGSNSLTSRFYMRLRRTAIDLDHSLREL